LEAKDGFKPYNRNSKSKLFSTEKMITQIIQLLQSQEWYGVSERVEIAKGKYQYNQTLTQVAKQYKRKIKSWRKN
jgi:hypothetical protein